MDCSSPYAMARLIELKDRFDVAFGNDADDDRHGIVTPSRGAAEPEPLPGRLRSRYLFRHRPRVARGRRRRQDGRVSSSLIDRVVRRPRPAPGRGAGRLQVVRRRAARRLARLRRRGERRRVVPAPRRHGLDDRQGRHHPRCLLAAEMTARDGRDPAALPRADRALRATRLRRIDVAGDAGAEGGAEEALRRTRSTPPSWRASRSPPCSPSARATARESAGSRSRTERGWFAARPSGTEDVYKIYAESFRSEDASRARDRRGAGDRQARAEQRG